MNSEQPWEVQIARYWAKYSVDPIARAEAQSVVDRYDRVRSKQRLDPENPDHMDDLYEPP